ncbi:TPA: ankyrin repeat domain-containing protein [Legionella feeleii]
MSASSQQLQIILNNDFFPTTINGQVKYAMAIASANLYKLKEPPSAKNPIILKQNDRNQRRYDVDRAQMQFVWTAFMVFGQRLPKMKFGAEAIKTEPEYHFAEYALEGYYWKAFKKDSLYDIAFKAPFLTDDMVNLTEFPAAFEGIPSEYKTIEEQESFLRKKREEELKEVNKRLREDEQRRQELLRKEEEQRIQKQKERLQSLSTRPLQKVLNGDLFPQPDAHYCTPEHVKYAMAIAKSVLFQLKEPPNYDNPIVLRGSHTRQLMSVWFAFMVFGEKSENGFPSSAIEIDSKSLNVSAYLYAGSLKRYAIDQYDRSYEEVKAFKSYITKDMLELTEFPELFKGISSAEYKTIEEQEDAKRKQLEEIRLKEEQKKREEEQKKQEEAQKKQAEEQRIRDERALAEKRRLEAEQEKARQEHIKNLSIRFIQEIGDSQGSINLLTISAYLRQGVNVNYKGSGGNTALIIALSSEKYTIAEYLLKQGADPHIANDAGTTAMDFVSSSSVLHELILKRDKELALQECSPAIRYSKLLWDEANKPDASLKLIKDYLSLGADINYKDAKGYTPLMLAVDNQNERLVEYLLKQGADPLLSNIHGEKASDLASQSSSLYSLLKKAEKRAGLGSLTVEERSSLLLQELAGSMEANAERIDELLDSGADINYQNSKGFTALMLAVDAGNERIAEYLLRNGANPLLRNKRGCTARQLASQHSGLSHILKAYELITATMNADLPAIKALLRTDNSIIDFQGPGGYSALLIAVEQNMTEVVNYLLAQGASLEITSEKGEGVFELVNSEEIMKLLQLEENTDEQDKEQFEKPASKAVERKHDFFYTPSQNTGRADGVLGTDQRLG